MSLKVLTAYMDGLDYIVPHKDSNGKVVDGVFEHLTCTHLRGIVAINKKHYRYDFRRDYGYTGNFASSPDLWLAQKILPSYVKTDDVYNAAFDLHDWLYSVKGEVTSPMITLSRSECDDFMRGVARESPTMQGSKWARFRCGVADLSVGLFAGGKAHWGNDAYCSMNKAVLLLSECTAFSPA